MLPAVQPALAKLAVADDPAEEAGRIGVRDPGAEDLRPVVVEDRRPRISEAKNLRADLVAAVRAGSVIERLKAVRLSDVHAEFIKDCREGIVFNRYGKRYTKKAVTDLDSSLKRLPTRIRKRQLDDITSSMLQSAHG